MEIKVETTFNIDIAVERTRLLKCFGDEPEVLARQVAILDAFERMEFNEAVELYNALPYSNTDECPEQEYVGEFFVDLVSFVLYSKGESRIIK
jgi:hypothetical protein